jgi:hypothetical protein
MNSKAWLTVWGGFCLLAPGEVRCSWAGHAKVAVGSTRTSGCIPLWIIRRWGLPTRGLPSPGRLLVGNFPGCQVRHVPSSAEWPGVVLGTSQTNILVAAFSQPYTLA